MTSRPDRLVTLAVDGVAIVVDLNLGARAVSWSVDGHELLGGAGPDPVEFGMYPMAPWAGRLRGNSVSVDGVETRLPPTYHEWALHGTVLREPAAAVIHTQTDVEARLLAQVEHHPAWPWATVVDIEWQLVAERLTTRITVHARDASFPAVVGWHPWFRRDVGGPAPLEWSLDATTRLVRGDDHLPTGGTSPFSPADGPFDDAFRATSAQVRWPGLLSVDVSGDGGWFVVFDERPDCLCVEPQSGPPDGLANGYGTEVRTAAPGSPVTLMSTWVMRRETPADRA